MGPSRKLLVLGVGACALSGLFAVQACTSETELNPQPLPPRDETNVPAPARDPEGKGGSDTGFGTPADGGTGDAADSGSG